MLADDEDHADEFGAAVAATLRRHSRGYSSHSARAYLWVRMVPREVWAT